MDKLHKTTLIVLTIGIVIIWVIIQMFYLPKFKEVRNLKRSLSESKVRNVRIQELGKDPAFFDNLHKKVDMYHAEMKALLPKEIKLSGLLRELSILAKKNDVSLLSIKPIEGVRPAENSEEGKINYLQSDIEIILECRYENLGRYVEAVENNNLTIMAIKDIHIQADEKDMDPNRLNVVLTIEAYYRVTS